MALLNLILILLIGGAVVWIAERFNPRLPKRLAIAIVLA